MFRSVMRCFNGTFDIPHWVWIDDHNGKSQKSALPEGISSHKGTVPKSCEFLRFGDVASKRAHESYKLGTMRLGPCQMLIIQFFRP